MSADRPLKLTAVIAETIQDLKLAMLRLKLITECIAVCDTVLRQQVESSSNEQERGKKGESPDPVCTLYRQLTRDYAKTQVSILRYRLKIVHLKLARSRLHDAKIEVSLPNGSESDTRVEPEARTPVEAVDETGRIVTSGKTWDTDCNLANVPTEAKEKVCADDKTSVGKCDSVAALPNAAIGGLDTHHDNVGVMSKPSKATQPRAMNHRSGQSSRRRTQSCVTSLLTMAKAPTAFFPRPISGAIPGEYFEEGQRCPSSLSALRNVTVNGVATHHESIGLGWSIGSTRTARLTQCIDGHILGVSWNDTSWS